MGTMDIALNIKKIRESKGMTLDTLAKKADVTKGCLSQVENFRTMPSVTLLYKLAEALEVEPAALLAVPENNCRYIFTPKGGGEVIEREHPESHFVYHALAKGKNSKAMEPFLLDLPPRASRKSVVTNGEEFIYMLCGEVDFHLGNEAVSMRPGDSLYFDGEIPHYPENTGDFPAQLLVIYSINQ